MITNRLVVTAIVAGFGIASARCGAQDYEIPSGPYVRVETQLWRVTPLSVSARPIGNVLMSLAMAPGQSPTIGTRTGYTDVLSSPASGTYFMLDPKVPANWTLFWKSAPCANSASTTYIQSHYQKTFGLCEVFDSTLFNYGTTNTGQYVYTGGGDKLVVGRNEVMYANDCRTSADNRYDFCYQADGNLVLYDGSTPVWASNTNGTSPGEVHMQGDGNLVVYDSGMTAVWDSQTSSQPGNFVIVQSNRCALMYSEDTNYIPWGTSSCNMSGGGTTQQPPIDPTNLYSSVSGSTVWLYWTPPPGPVNDYILEAGTYPGGTNVGVFYLNNQPYSTSYGVAPGTYYVRVKARNNGGTGPPTADLAVYVP